MKKWISLALVLALSLSLCACGKEQPKDEAVERVISLINGLGNVALSSSSAIAGAEEAYAALTDAQKAAVTNYKTLLDAKSTYNRVMNVFSLIEAIGTVTAESEEAILAAEAAYDLLPERDRKHITNYEKLTAARDAFTAIASVVVLDKDIFNLYFQISNDCGVNKTYDGTGYSTKVAGNILVDPMMALEVTETVSVTIRVHYAVGRYRDGAEEYTTGTQDFTFRLTAENPTGAAPFNPGT